MKPDEDAFRAIELGVPLPPVQPLEAQPIVVEAQPIVVKPLPIKTDRPYRRTRTA